jgi:NAD(P)-dependent dehydrogenase (short-subunit alcohol dehydrogenase family)
MGRAGTPDEVARVIAFLSGPDSEYLVGRDDRDQRRDAHAMTARA